MCFLGITFLIWIADDCDTIVVQQSRGMKECKDISDQCAVVVNSQLVDGASIKPLVGGFPAISDEVTHVEGSSVSCSSMDEYVIIYRLQTSYLH